MNIRFYNARILSLVNGLDIENGEVWVQGERILAVGKPQEKAPVWDREIDAEGNLIMPGFKNAHTHSAMTFLRSYADDLPLLDWLSQQVFPMEAKLKAEHIVPLCKLAFLEYLSSGVTACFDMYMFPEKTVEAALETGFRTVLCGCYSNFVNSIENMEAQHVHFNQLHALISHQIGFHAEYTTDKEHLQALAALAQKYHAPVCTHNSESLRETQDCLAKTGQTPTAYMAALGLFEYGGVFYHGVHLNAADIAICKEKGIAVVSNPGSNVKLASGIAPLVALQEAGVTLALGTDGPASNNALDMFREMFLATGLQKLREGSAAAMPAGEVLKMATLGSAAAMGLSECDTLAEGKYADLIMINLARPNMQPLHHIVNNLVYSGSKENVKLTMVNGKILYENGEFFIGESAADVYEKVNEIAKEITAP